MAYLTLCGGTNMREWINLSWRIIAEIQCPNSRQLGFDYLHTLSQFDPANGNPAVQNSQGKIPYQYWDPHMIQGLQPPFPPQFIWI